MLRRQHEFSKYVLTAERPYEYYIDSPNLESVCIREAVTCSWLDLCACADAISKFDGLY